MTSTDRLTTALAGRYRIERQLGQGGMATVYLAADVKHDRQVAIKVLRPELAAVLGGERFVQEIKTTAALQHPHILPLFDSGEADGFLFYVMPYVEGETLRDKLNRETQLGIDEAVRITREVADALDYAHRHGVIHRDIKPENILLHDGRPVVADFGIALALSAAAGGRMTETGMSLGTPHYMSPEQATADKDITARSDIYSLASVLYEMLTGNPPHTGSSAQQIIMRIIAEPVPPVTALRRNVPPNVVAALAKALEKVPADRFDSAKAFADALVNPSFTGTTTAGALGFTRPRVHASTSVPVVAALVVLTVVAVWGWLRPTNRASSLGVVRFSVPVAPNMIPRFTLTSRLAFSPDGTRLAYSTVDTGQRGQNSLYVRRLDGEVEVAVAGSDTASRWAPCFSPDGAWLAFVFRSGDRSELRRMALADGSVQTIARSDTLGDIVGLTWGDDGTIVLATTSRFYRVPASGGEWRVLAEVRPEGGATMRRFQPEMLPGSKVLLFHAVQSYEPESAKIMALTLATGEQKSVLANAMNPVYVAGGYLLFVRQGTLMGVAFDAARAEVRGEPVVLMPDVMQSLYGPGLIYETGAAQIAVSPGGHLAWVAGGVGQPDAYRVVRITARGDTIPLAMDSKRWLSFRVSPDESRVAALSARGSQVTIWIHDLARGVTRRLATGAFNNFPMAWSPDGRSIVFSSERDQPGGAQLYRMPSDGSGAPVRLATSDHYQFAADWSSLGAIAYADCDPHYVCDVGVIPPDSQPRPFVATPADEIWPAFSPDGHWLAYASNESGRFEVWVRPYPGGEPATQVSPNGGLSPVWSRDGRTLYYTRNNVLMAVDVGPGPVLRLGGDRVYHTHWPCCSSPVRMSDVFSDGSFVVPVPDTSVPHQPAGAQEINIMLNFSDILKQRVAQ